MQDRAVLKEIFKNSGLSENDSQTVIDAFQKVEFKKNEYVLKEGQVANDYYFIESGFMRAFAIDPAGNEITTGFFSDKKLVLEV